MGGGSERERIVALDKRYVWRPYTEMGDYRAHGEPLVVAREQQLPLLV